MAEIDKDLIRARMAGLLERVDEPPAFDAGLHDLLLAAQGAQQVLSLIHI